MRALLIRLGLRFADPAVESAFRDWYREHHFRETRLIMIGGVAAWLSCIIWDITVAETGMGAVWMRLITASLCLLVPAALFAFRGLERYWQASMVPWGIPMIVGVCVHAWLYPDAVIYGYGGVALMMWGVFVLLSFRVVYAFLMGIVLAIAYIVTVALAVDSSGPVTGSVASWLILILLMGAYAGASIERARRNVFNEYRRSDQLLRNLLPDPIVDRMRVESSHFADHHDDVTVLFADVVGFSALTRSLDATELVALLDRIFGDFDAAIAARGLEKIKTVGDSYMVAGGVPNARPDHADAVVDLASEMMRIIDRISREEGRKLRLRIGIHTGSVVAGTLGAHRLHYDLWGETVNIASRMESHGEPGRIQISGATRTQLGPGHELTQRGVLKIKGHGDCEAFFVGSASEPADGVELRG